MPSETDRLIDELRQKIAALTTAQADLLARRLSTAFIAGHRKSGATEISDLQRQAVKKIAAENMGAITEFNEALGLQLEDRVRELILEGKGYSDIKQEMKPYIREVFGSSGTVTIDRTGQTRQIIQVDRYGKLHRIEKTISQSYTTNTEAYADMLSRTSVHAAYSKGRREGYKALGMKKWRYISAQDERVRPHHLALHGRIFEIDSEDEARALEILSEPHCRCRQIPFFDDPGLDTPQAEFDKQKDAAGLKFENGEWVFSE